MGVKLATKVAHCPLQTFVLGPVATCASMLGHAGACANVEVVRTATHNKLHMNFNFLMVIVVLRLVQLL